MKKPERSSGRPIQRLPIISRQFQQRERADHIRFDKRLGAGNGTIDMGLCGQMDDPFRAKLGNGAPDGDLVTDIRLNETVIGMAVHGLQGGQRAGIGELVDGEDLRSRFEHEVADDGGTDETRPRPLP